MKISVIAFSAKGACLAQNLKDILQEKYTCQIFSKPFRNGLMEVKTDLNKWTVSAFKTEDVIIFIGAAGIAVRSIGPVLKDKLKDPAVLVIDELGKYVIPILSGHVGGGNAIARQIAKVLEAEPVITTATDLSGVFAIDVFMKKNEFALEEAKKQIYKKISVLLLEGKRIPVYQKESILIKGELPEGCFSISKEQFIELIQSKKNPPEALIAITDEKLPVKEWLLTLKYKKYILGIGCRKGIAKEEVRKAVHTFLQTNQIPLTEVKAISSINLKESEPALISLAEEMEVPFIVFTAEELMNLPGVFTGSAFVKEITGVDNVCERAALKLALSEGLKASLKVYKTVFRGVTCALAEYEQIVDWSRGNE